MSLTLACKQSLGHLSPLLYFGMLLVKTCIYAYALIHTHTNIYMYTYVYTRTHFNKYIPTIPSNYEYLLVPTAFFLIMHVYTYSTFVPV